jgi:GntR family transcriptional regulator/MocR family aminotransferase
MLIEKRENLPLYQQIYEHIRAEIESGAYPQARMLPSIRALSDDLCCSRNTVVAAYDMLQNEGYIESRPGSGYVVQDVTLLHKVAEGVTGGREGGLQAGAGAHDGAGAGAADGAACDLLHSGAKDVACAAPIEFEYDFCYGNLEEGIFPAQAWKQITDDVLLGAGAKMCNVYNSPMGEVGLRCEIARRLEVQRGIKCSPEQVVVQAGTQAAIQNLLMLFDPARGCVAMENPGYDGACHAFVRSAFEVAHCSVANLVSEIRQSGAQLAYVTPSSQFPTCKVMNEQTRHALLTWANETDSYILEDDYCRDFRYWKRPVAPLESMDSHGRVIYMNTFSKSLSPALRMSYIVLPRQLVGTWLDVFDGTYASVPWLSQEVLRRFLESGQWDRHLRRVQAKYKRKYELIVSAIEREMAGHVRVIECGTGLHLLVEVQDSRSQSELVAQAAAAGVHVYPTAKYWAGGAKQFPNLILVGFSAIPEDKITPGIQALARAWFPTPK